MQTYDEFVNPKSMWAPGVAGAMTMAITNAIAVNFNLPRPWLGLLVSGFFAAAAVTYAQMRTIEKAFFGILNTLIIFSVALGTNTLGSVVASPEGHASLLRLEAPLDWVVPSAIAQSPGAIPDGTLIQGSGSELYLVEEGKRRLVPDQKTRSAAGLDGRPIVTVADTQLQTIPMGTPIPSKRFFSSWIQ